MDSAWTQERKDRREELRRSVIAREERLAESARLWMRDSEPDLGGGTPEPSLGEGLRSPLRGRQKGEGRTNFAYLSPSAMRQPNFRPRPSQHGTESTSLATLGDFSHQVKTPGDEVGAKRTA